MAYLLAGDLGGTKTLLSLVLPTSADKSGQSGSDKLATFQQSYPSQAYSSFVPLVQQFLADAQTHLGGEIAVSAACFGIAGAVIDRASYLPNLDWHIDAERLQAELNIPQISLINDFVAIGYGISCLSAADIHTIQAGQPRLNAPIAVIGAGTGLGQCFLVYNDRDYQVVAAEGGHTDFAARSTREFELYQYLCKHKQLDRISNERVISGSGIVGIYQFLRDTSNFSETPEVASVVTAWESQSETAPDPAALISTLAIAKTDPLCEAAMAMFISAYGAEAGNLALKILPYGGFYIAGGIATKNLPLFEDGTFLGAFNHKGRVSNLLTNIPVRVILNPQVGLLGALDRAAKLRIDA
ncbi:glucokinase [Chamaesiphon minutus]|uniref:Glucokinase n=1 Tax=Chamaesiphon minutus (strain ATCC 27169 / PCC 6605) TaxID=1173020 RepID=K9UNS6_CHAP6|nr:glucokinase [Chamaesiphon minutus]AFY96308.1 glucokinase [Chamaesiphon minutus PCC 6605]